MADTKISALASKAAPTGADLAVIVDVADTSMAASGTDKQVTLASLPPAGSTGQVQYNNAGARAGAAGLLIGASGNPNLPATAAPGTPTSGDLWHDSTQHAFASYHSGIAGTLPRALFVQSASGVASGTSEVTVLGTGVGTLTLPANYLVAGRTLRLTLRGIYSSVSGTCTVKVKLGATTVATCSNSISASMTNRAWTIDLLLTCQSAGASGTVVAAGTHVRCTTTATAAIVLDLVPAVAGASTLDTTGALAVDVTLTPGNAGNVFTCQAATLESLN